MKKFKLLICVLAFFLTFTTSAQQFEHFVDSEISVNNGRRMMLQYVQARNFERVAEIYHLLNERTLADNCVAFTLSEEFLITVLTGNWDYFFAIAEYFSDIAEINLCTPIHNNSLINALFSEVENNISQILKNALAADLTPKEIQLLELYLHLIEHGTDEAYRQKLRAFRRQHPQSEYSDFVRNYFPQAPIRVDIGPSIGVTQVFPMGSLSNYFSTTTALHIAVDFRINRILLGFQAEIGSMRLNAPLLSSITGYDYNLLEGDRFLFENFMFPIGYTLIRSNRFELTPFVGFGGTILRSNIHTGEGSRYREFDVVNSFTISPGLRAEFLLASLNQGSDIINFRFDVGYNRPVRFSNVLTQGNMFYARAGIVWWFGNL